MKLTQSSERNLRKVHPALIQVIRRAASNIGDGELGFIVTCGIRTIEEQRRLYRVGATRTMKSRHLAGRTTGLSHAFDIAATLNGKVRWDWPLYAKLAKEIKKAAKELGIPIEWGGDWKSFKDGPHYQLPWLRYPG